MKKTPLNNAHRGLGARMVDFGGWDMPVQYSGVIDEHLAVRGAAGLFDVSHMGEIEVRGSGALDYIQELGVTRTVVDMSGVRWINSTALGVLMYLFSELSRDGRSVVFAGANERVRQIFNATKLDRILTLADTLEAAVEQLPD